MMKRVFCIALCLTLLLACSACGKDVAPEEKGTSAGGTESQTQTTEASTPVSTEPQYVLLREESYTEGGGRKDYRDYYYDVAGNVIRECYYLDDGELWNETQYQYDENGVLRSEKLVSAAGEIRSETYYNENGDILRDVSYNEDGSVYRLEECAYDDAGLCVFQRSEQGNRRLTMAFTYDDTGRLTYKAYYDADTGTFSSDMVYTYDENGRLILETGHNEEGVSKHGYGYAYDDAGNLIRKDTYTNGQVSSYWEYTYDEKGNQLTAREFTDGVLTSAQRHTYDENGCRVLTEDCTDESRVWVSYRAEYDGDGNRLSATYYYADCAFSDRKVYIYGSVVLPNE